MPVGDDGAGHETAKQSGTDDGVAAFQSGGGNHQAFRGMTHRPLLGFAACNKQELSLRRMGSPVAAGGTVQCKDNDEGTG